MWPHDVGKAAWVTRLSKSDRSCLNPPGPFPAACFLTCSDRSCPSHLQGLMFSSWLHDRDATREGVAELWTGGGGKWVSTLSILPTTWLFPRGVPLLSTLMPLGVSPKCGMEKWK